MENEILKVLMKNSDVSTIFMAVGMVYLGKQVANMAANIAEIHKSPKTHFFIEKMLEIMCRMPNV